MSTIKTKFIGANQVTYSTIQQTSVGSVLIGNPTGSAADVEEITLGAGLSFSGSSLIATGANPVGNVAANDSNVVFTNSSNRIQICNPTAARTYTLPTTSIVAGDIWTFYNQATAAANVITIQSSGSNTVCLLPPLGKIILYTAVATPTTAANWILTERMTQWVSTTLTYTGLGTVTGNSALGRVIGDTLYVKAACTTGTLSSVTASATLPFGYVIDTTKVAIANTTSGPGEILGDWAQPVANDAGYTLANIDTSTSVIYFGGNIASVNVLSPQLGATYMDSSTTLIFNYSVPVTF